jgi:periplasmic divalent cation tolerance protein
MTELCEVVITAQEPDWLYSIARPLVEDRLAASAHNFTPVRPIYRWQGQVYERAEGRVSLHTSREPVAEIVTRAQREHPTRSPACPHDRSSTETPTTSRGSTRDRFRERTNARTGHLTRGPGEHGQAEQDHDDTLRSTTAPRCRIEPYLDQERRRCGCGVLSHLHRRALSVSRRRGAGSAPCSDGRPRRWLGGCALILHCGGQV